MADWAHKRRKTGWIWGKESLKGIFSLQLGWDMAVVSLVRFCFRRIFEKHSAGYVVQRDWDGILWSPFVAFSMVDQNQNIGPSAPATLLASWSLSVKGTTIYLPLIMSSLTCFSGYLVFVTLRFYPWSCVSHPVHWSPSAASPSRRETGEAPSLDAKTGNRKVEFQAAQFISFQKSILSISPLFPHSLTLSLSLPSLFLFLASHRLAVSQARVVGGVWCFILVPTTLCCMGGWVRVRKSGAKRGGEERLVGGGRFLKISLEF